jgi:hypothetical protein
MKTIKRAKVSYKIILVDKSENIKRARNSFKKLAVNKMKRNVLIIITYLEDSHASSRVIILSQLSNYYQTNFICKIVLFSILVVVMLNRGKH